MPLQQECAPKKRNLRLSPYMGSEKGEVTLSTTERFIFPSDRTDALELLMSTYGTKVLHLAYSYLKDRQLAEDVAQEVFIKAYQHWSSFRGQSSVYTWLYKITVNLCRDKARSAWWRKLLPSEEPWAGAEVHALPDENPEEAALQSDQREILMQQVLQLPEAYREVVMLYYYHDLSTIEIAQVCGQNENTVKTRLFRARAMLKEMLVKRGVGR